MLYGLFQIANTHAVSFHPKGAQNVILNTLIYRYDQAATVIQHGVFPTMWRRYAAKFDAGEDAVFGRSAVVNFTGLRHNRQVFVWSDVEGIDVERGRAAVIRRADGKRLQWMSTSEIANLSVYVALVDALANASSIGIPRA